MGNRLWVFHAGPELVSRIPSTKFLAIHDGQTPFPLAKADVMDRKPQRALRVLPYRLQLDEHGFVDKRLKEYLGMKLMGNVSAIDRLEVHASYLWPPETSHWRSLSDQVRLPEEELRRAAWPPPQVG